MTPERVPIIDPVYFSGGVADPEGHAAYVAAAGGVAAVRLRDGHALWRSERVQHPLVCDGRRLVAASTSMSASSVVEVAVLDASSNGEVMVVSEPMPLPSWVTASAESLGTLRFAARVMGRSLHLEWEAHARYAGGASPPAQIERTAMRRGSGVCEVDLESGSVSPAPVNGQERAETDVRRPPLAPDDTAEPWCVDDMPVRLLWDAEGEEQVLLLERGETQPGGSADVLELARGQGLVAQVTPDGCDVLVHREPPAGADRWLVLSVPSGRRSATVTHDHGASRPAILGSRVYYHADDHSGAVWRRVLRARALASDALLWELALDERPISAPPRLRP